MNYKCHTDWFTANGVHESKKTAKVVRPEQQMRKANEAGLLASLFLSLAFGTMFNPCDKEKGALTRKKEMDLVTVQSIACF